MAWKSWVQPRSSFMVLVHSFETALRTADSSVQLLKSLKSSVTPTLNQTTMPIDASHADSNRSDRDRSDDQSSDQLSIANSSESAESIAKLVQKASESAIITPDQAIQSRCTPWLTTLAYPLGCWVVLPLYFSQMRIIGQENLPKDGPIILAPTHRSRWDAIMVAAHTGRFVTGRDVRFMVTADEFKGFQSWIIPRLGGFPINPRRPSIASLRYGLEVLQNQEMMVIFPEGGIFRDNELHPLKPGLARLALQAEASRPGLNVKIVPIAIQYSDPYPTWGSDVTMQIGESLRVADYDRGQGKQDAKRLTSDLASALQGLMIPDFTSEALEQS